jgi:hypothetical protein
VTGAVPTGPWRIGGSASHFAVMVRDLAAAILWPTWFDLSTNEDSSARPRHHHHLFAELDLRMGLEVFGIIAAVLSATAGGYPTGIGSAALKEDGPSADPVRLVRILPAGVRCWLRAASCAWAPVPAGAVGYALDVEEKRLCEATSARDLADRNAAWVRDAAPRRRAAAIKRIAARARRRAEARVVRKGQGRDPRPANWRSG